MIQKNTPILSLAAKTNDWKVFVGIVLKALKANVLKAQFLPIVIPSDSMTQEKCKISLLSI